LPSSIEEIKASNLAETPRTIHSQGWWTESLLKTAELNDTNLISKGAPAGGHQHLLSWAKGMLSAEAIGTIVKYDISCAEELIQLTDEEWVPIPWLLGTEEDHPPGGPEMHTLLHDLLVSHPPITVDGDVVPIQTEDECFPQIGTSILIAENRCTEYRPTNTSE
jgi:hypothetical protein